MGSGPFFHCQRNNVLWMVLIASPGSFLLVKMTSNDLSCPVVENFFWCVFRIHFNNSTKKTGHIINNLLTSFIRSLQGNLRPALDQRGQYVIAPGLRFPCNDLTLSLLGVFIGF